MKPALNPVDEEKYSQLAPLAVIALILGIVSVLAFIGPLFYLVPIAAVGVALLALGKIAQSDGVLTGSALARVGIALATVCLIASLVRGNVRDRLLKDQASDTSLRWLQFMAAGDVQAARALLSGEGASSLVPRPEPGTDAPPHDELERMALDRLKLDPLVQDYANVKEPIVKVDKAAEPQGDGTRTITGVDLVIGDPATGSHRHVQLQLSRNKVFETEGEPWRIDHWNAGPAHGAH